MSDTPFSFINLEMLLRLPGVAREEELRQFACNLRVAIPAIVVSFDPVKQTVRVQPTIQENIRINGVPTPTNLPVLEDVLLGGYRGGGFAVTLPLRAGDEGVVLFLDMCVDAWWQSGGTENNQAERRRHSLSDGIFFPMCWSQPRNLATYSASALQIRSDNNQTQVSVSAGEIQATPDGGTTLITVLPNSVTLKATTVTVQGALVVTGNATIDSKSFVAHEHGGVTTGIGVTGPPI